MPKYSSIQFLTLNEYHQKLNGTEESDSQQTNDEGKQADPQSVPNDSQAQPEKKEETSKAKDTETDAPQPENKAKENYESSKKFLEEEYKLRKRYRSQIFSLSFLRLKTDIDSLKRVYQDKENSFYEEKKFLDRIETNDFVPLKKVSGFSLLSHFLSPRHFSPFRQISTRSWPPLKARKRVLRRHLTQIQHVTSLSYSSFLYSFVLFCTHKVSFYQLTAPRDQLSINSSYFNQLSSTTFPLQLLHQSLVLQHG